MTALYLYPVWLRLWHWTQAALFLTLMVTGLRMHYAEWPWPFPFTGAVAVHNGAGIGLTLMWVVFLIGQTTTDNARHYRLPWRDLPRQLWRQMRWYAWGIFVGEPHPFQVTAAHKLNALQTLSYLGAMGFLMPLLILSGWGFLFSVQLPPTLFGVGTVWIVALVHLASSWLLVLFLIVHLYMITTGETPTTNLKAMVSGWHREEATSLQLPAISRQRAATSASVER
jgi:thiosulfate reductase cytochrome b subunit